MTGAIHQAQLDFAKMTAANPQTRYTPPRCSDEEPYHSLVAGVDTPAPRPCSHSDTFHRAPQTFADGGTRQVCGNHPVGLKRGRDGVFRWARQSVPKAETPIPIRTQENIVACAAVGLSYWSDHSTPGMVWAVDDDQQPHVVSVDRKAGKSEHYCLDRWVLNAERKGMSKSAEPCHRPVEGVQRWERPHTVGALMLAMEPKDERGTPLFMKTETVTVSDYVNSYHPYPTEEIPMPTPLISSSAIHGPSKTLHAGRTTAAAKARAQQREQMAAKKAVIQRPTPPRPSVYDANTEPEMTREAARSLLLHDPDYLGDITNAALVDLLEDETVAPHHDSIRRELKDNRGLTQRSDV